MDWIEVLCKIIMESSWAIATCLRYIEQSRFLALVPIFQRSLIIPWTPPDWINLQHFSQVFMNKLLKLLFTFHSSFPELGVLNVGITGNRTRQRQGRQWRGYANVIIFHILSLMWLMFNFYILCVCRRGRERSIGYVCR